MPLSDLPDKGKPKACTLRRTALSLIEGVEDLFLVALQDTRTMIANRNADLMICRDYRHLRRFRATVDGGILKDIPEKTP